MPAIKNVRHERFAQALADGKSASEAYVTAGFKANTGNASTLKNQQSVSKRVNEILAEREMIHQQATAKAIEAVGLTKEWVIERLVENANRAMQAEPVTRDGMPTGEYTYQGAVANRALELLGKEIGMFVDRVKQDTTVRDASNITDAELAEIADHSRRSGEGTAVPPKGKSEPPKLH